MREPLDSHDYSLYKPSAAPYAVKSSPAEGQLCLNGAVGEQSFSFPFNTKYTAAAFQKNKRSSAIFFYLTPVGFHRGGCKVERRECGQERYRKLLGVLGQQWISPRPFPNSTPQWKSRQQLERYEELDPYPLTPAQLQHLRNVSASIVLLGPPGFSEFWSHS